MSTEQPAIVGGVERVRTPHLDFAGEPMKAGQFREPLEQPSAAATAMALTATPETFPTDGYGLAMWLDAALTARPSAPAEVGSACGGWHLFADGEDANVLKLLAWSINAYDSPRVQAFARHRLAASPPAQQAGVEDALREALEPFVKIALAVEHTDKRDGDIVHRQIWDGKRMELTKDDFRRAARALAALRPSTDAAAQPISNKDNSND